MENDSLTPAKYFAMKKSIELGRNLQTDHPEIADLFVRGNTLVGIVEELNIQSKYGVNQNFACSAVQRAISGYNGRYTGIEEEYGGLIEEEKRKKIGKEHQLKSSLENGRNAYDEKKGMFARTLEQQIEDGRNAYPKGLGKMTTEQRREIGRKSYAKGLAKKTTEQRREYGFKAAIGRGFKPWTDEEKEYVYQLSLNPEYQYSEGGNKGGANRELIALELNITFHDCEEVRTAYAVGSSLSVSRKAKGDKKETRIIRWTDEEKEYVYQLSLNPEYQYSEGICRGKANRKLIASEVNNVFHDGDQIRTINAIGTTITSCRKLSKIIKTHITLD